MSAISYVKCPPTDEREVPGPQVQDPEVPAPRGGQGGTLQAGVCSPRGGVQVEDGHHIAGAFA